MAEVNYFKTDRADVVAAVNHYFTERQLLTDESNVFAKKFGSDLVMYRTSFPDFSFGGLVFKEQKDIFRWTKPDENRIQRPRPATKFKTKDKAEQQKLVEEWYAAIPKRKVDMTPILKLIGLCWSDFFLGGSFSFFEFDGFVYFKTSRKPDVFLIEILASELQAAHEAWKAQAAA